MQAVAFRAKCESHNTLEKTAGVAVTESNYTLSQMTTLPSHRAVAA